MPRAHENSRGRAFRQTLCRGLILHRGATGTLPALCWSPRSSRVQTTPPRTCLAGPKLSPCNWLWLCSLCWCPFGGSPSGTGSAEPAARRRLPFGVVCSLFRLFHPRYLPGRGQEFRCPPSAYCSAHFTRPQGVSEAVLPTFSTVQIATTTVQLISDLYLCNRPARLPVNFGGHLEVPTGSRDCGQPLRKGESECLCRLQRRFSSLRTNPYC